MTIFNFFPGNLLIDAGIIIVFVVLAGWCQVVLRFIRPVREIKSNKFSDARTLFLIEVLASLLLLAGATLFERLHFTSAIQLGIFRDYFVLGCAFMELVTFFPIGLMLIRRSPTTYKAIFWALFLPLLPILVTWLSGVVGLSLGLLRHDPIIPQ
ncbi:MAG TPA: hypothetical protein VK786_05170 [bacterium]|jgi:hypothetical protein|nr:hypothetical protein [bacterium]